MTEKKEILLNVMYTGSWLDENIGHEIINLFRSDNGQNYIYVLPWGTMDKKHNNQIETILLVRRCNADTFEILAKAVGLTQIAIRKTNSKKEHFGQLRDEQIRYITENDIRYGGVLLSDIFKIRENTNDFSVPVTFRAENVIKVKKPLFVCANELGEADLHFPRQSLKGYVSSENNEKAYAKFLEIINNAENWEDKNSTKKINPADYDKKEISFIEIIRKEYDELSYSNMLACFFRKYPELFCEFSKEVLKIDAVQPTFKITREEKNIDLLFTDDHYAIVIENKIRSGINGIKEKRQEIGKKESQLSKYFEYIQNTYVATAHKKAFFFLLIPDYHSISLKDLEKAEQYTIIHYSAVFDFFSKRKINDIHYADFLSALKIHTTSTDNRREEEMYYRFAEAIKKSRLK